MKTNLSDSIRAFRTERGLTQERLAEAMGVTVGTVSKWESGASSPELKLVVELAEFFEVSTDMLLGCTLAGSALESQLARMRELRNAKRFDDAALLAEQLLIKYPNSFLVAHTGGVLYSMKGIEQHSRKSHQRALELYQRSLELISQNTDPKTDERAINAEITSVYICLGKYDDALELLKKDNSGGANDLTIGFLLANFKQSGDEALSYLSSALANHVNDTVKLFATFAEIYSGKRDFTSALDALNIALAFVTGLERKGTACCLGLYEVQLLGELARTEAARGGREAAICYARRAKAAAELFDASPSSSFAGMKLYQNERPLTCFSDYGSSALEGLKASLGTPETDWLLEELNAENK